MIFSPICHLGKSPNYFAVNSSKPNSFFGFYVNSQLLGYFGCFGAVSECAANSRASRKSDFFASSANVRTSRDNKSCKRIYICQHHYSSSPRTITRTVCEYTSIIILPLFSLSVYLKGEHRETYKIK